MSLTATRKRSVLAAACLLAALCQPGLARADETAKVLERCSHGEVPSGFSQAAYAKALRQIPTVLNEYSNCEELIRRAELTAAGAGKGSSGGGPGALPGSGGTAPITPPTPAEQQTLSEAAVRDSTPVNIGRAPLVPGVVHADIASTVSSLPTSLLALVALLSAGALLALARALAGWWAPAPGQAGRVNDRSRALLARIMSRQDGSDERRR